MDLILKQLGDLLLGAIPTVVMLLLLYGLYHVILHKPLQRILAERHTRTEGAVQRARADIAAAEAKTAEYEQKLRDARMTIFKGQEERRKMAEKARAAAMADARTKAEAKVAEAKKGIHAESEAAQVGLRAEADRLANEIVAALLRPLGGAYRPSAGGQS
ncbi:H+-transporting two-sector ATPase, B/B' subunit [Candidatus Koribacter versatilis Ellin345]|uniref:ATP synthase subunit b n=1 Tax=Koribacter versatilis (strain Ellin345) TaxID=204669 RepID=Q1IIG3_KORVE|nr:H+-transporting two-sector ATPase subunit B/B' [Candidatus Koribacter versatilis]ABF43337.1 H+-transporting two-sector ATPase, B/B' subunit [Candidatus Koribacter versatilis Ellin345]